MTARHILYHVCIVAPLKTLAAGIVINVVAARYWVRRFKEES